MPAPTPVPALDHGNSSIPDRLLNYADAVRTHTNQLFETSPGLEPLYGMMAYHLGWVDKNFAARDSRAGKSLRPALCILVGEGLGAALPELTPFAAGIELLHNFSLIHDDIQDRSATRRNRPTVWTVWGDAQAINVGDAMYSLAHVAWLQSDLAEKDPHALIEIARSLELTILRLCEGQYLDMSAEGRLDVSSEEYVRMIGRKTAALIGEATWVGARIATGDSKVLEAARAFGVELGLAFQIRDDVLGIWGNEQETGKSASSDIATRKMTLPIIVALEAATPQVRDELRLLYGAAPDSGSDNERRIRELLEIAGAGTVASELEERHWKAAMDALDHIPLVAGWRDGLKNYARSFVGRRA